MLGITFGSGQVAAQVRPFPAGTKVGELLMGYFPEGTIDGKAVRFAPGTRFLNADNSGVMPSTLQQLVVVRYRLDAQGQVDRVWILSRDEVAQARAAQPAR